MSKASTLLLGPGTAPSSMTSALYSPQSSPTAHDGEHALVCSKPDVGGSRPSRVLVSPRPVPDFSNDPHTHTTVVGRDAIVGPSPTTQTATTTRRLVKLLLHARRCANHAIHGRFNPLSQHYVRANLRHQECAFDNNSIT